MGSVDGMRSQAVIRCDTMHLRPARGADACRARPWHAQKNCRCRHYAQHVRDHGRDGVVRTANSFVVDTRRTLLKSSSWTQVSREMARLCSVSIKSHQSSSSGQPRSANNSRHMPTAVSSCTHFCPFSQENLRDIGPDLKTGADVDHWFYSCQHGWRLDCTAWGKAVSQQVAGESA